MSNSPKTIEEIILGLPKAEQVMVKRLRAIVQECLPKATEKIFYGTVPFYTRHRMICFIWPQSIQWGPKCIVQLQEARGVTLGFCQGNRMANEDGVLKADGRKQVYTMSLRTLQEIKEDQIRALLFEADLVDQTFEKKKKKKISR